MKHLIKVARLTGTLAILIGAVWFLGLFREGGSPPGAWTRDCTRPVGWYIGEIDERFGISTAEVLEAAELAAAVWNADRPQRPYFAYDESGTLPIHLKYDPTVNLVIGEQDEFQRKIDHYNDQLAAYVAKLEKHSEEVERFKQGRVSGHRDLVRMRLNRASEELQREQQRLQALEASLEEQRPRRRGVLHLHVGRYEQQVSRFGRSERIIDERILIMQFSDFDELVLVLAHEFGHALGLDHVNDPQAVMHSHGTVPPHGRIRLTPADREALREICGTTRRIHG